MARFAEVLPRLRRRIRKDLNRNELARERILAAIVRMMDKVHLRVGNDRSCSARGATTLSEQHVSLDDVQVTLDFPSKSGQHRHVEFCDEKVAKVIRSCEELSGQFLMSYEMDCGCACRVDSTDVNDYLRQVSGEDVTAKDFRTWWGSVTAFSELKSLSNAASLRERKRVCRSALKSAAQALGNTVAVCRSSYVHPGLLAAAESGELPRLLPSSKSGSEMTLDELSFCSVLPQLDFA